MTLSNLLLIDERRLPPETWKAALYINSEWREAGEPTDSDFLSEFLDCTLMECERLGLKYPKIYLRRLKELQRGEWPPAPGRETTPRVRKLPPATGETQTTAITLARPLARFRKP